MRSRLVLSLSLLLLVAVTAEARKNKKKKEEPEAEPKWDVATADLGPTQTRAWTVDEGTWVSLDVSPDGRTIVFDLVGDLYSLPIEGGEATPLRSGRAYDLQPRFSPDGEWISFTSDAGGGDNIWVMRADGSEARQVTQESFRLLNNAVWTPDGRSLVARKHFTSTRSLGAGEMWLYDVAAGGSGVQLTERPNDQKDVGEPELSPDGRYLYYSIDATPGGVFEYNKDPNGTIYRIRRLDLIEGGTETVVAVPGGSVRPELSPDGTRLAYVRRVRTESVLMLRDLASGIEQPLYDGLYRDQQETWSIFGAYPGFAWTPDGRSIVIWGQGKLLRIGVADGSVREIPFRARIEHEVVEALRFAPEFGGETMAVRNVRWPRISPDGSRIVFQALGRLWLRDSVAGATPRPLTRRDDRFEFHPRWSPDGRRIVFTTWDDIEAGRVVTVAADGSDERVVVSRPGHYVEPAYAPDGRRIVYRRAGADTYRGNRFATEQGIYVVPAAGGSPRRVTQRGARPLFTADGERLLLLEFGDTKRLYSVDLLGGDRRELATSDRAMEMLPSPDGRWLAFTELWQVYVAPLPAAGRAIAVGPQMKNLPVRKLSEVSGEYLDWSADGATLSFGLGPELTAVDVAPLFEHADEAPEPERRTTALGWEHPADLPDSDVLFVGATLLTMRETGEGRETEVIEDGALHVRGNRIVAVGRRGELRAAGAREIDVRGKTIVPGYVDIHAHTGSSNNGMHAESNWAFLANLAFGVTTTHDPSNNTGMILSSRELVEAGRTLGPRIFSTGTILYGAEGDFKAVIDSREDAARHLRRLQAYGAFTAKSYNQPRRDQRQWVIDAARELEMMIAPEGGSTYHHNITMFLDGHTTLEHALPLAPLYEDVMTLIAGTRTAYTPTLVVGYGGLWGENYWYQKSNVWENERLLEFVPRAAVDPRSRRRVMVPDDEFNHIELARTAAEFVERGGIAEIGAHGQMQGLGVHWELWMFHQGGLSAMDSLRVATLLGARSLGMDHLIGSLEPGKLADLLVLDGDPREAIEHTADVGMVMINGRLFDARTLAQIAPSAEAPPVRPPLDSIPAEMLGVDCLAGVE